MADVVITVSPENREDLWNLHSSLEDLGFAVEIEYDTDADYLRSLEIIYDGNRLTFEVSESILSDWQRDRYWAQDADTVAEGYWRE